jgi:MerR family mercuric resistance operon transcriptional regulator
MLDFTKSREFPIGAVSEHTAVHIETIRYYEKIGVMPKPDRTAGGNRVYNIDRVRRLNFIKRSRELGFSLNEIRELLELVDGGDFTCGEIHAITTRQADNIRAKIKHMRRLERVLEGMAAECGRGILPECPVVEVLSEL